MIDRLDLNPFLGAHRLWRCSTGTTRRCPTRPTIEISPRFVSKEAAPCAASNLDFNFRDQEHDEQDSPDRMTDAHTAFRLPRDLLATVDSLCDELLSFFVALLPSHQKRSMNQNLQKSFEDAFSCYIRRGSDRPVPGAAADYRKPQRVPS